MFRTLLAKEFLEQRRTYKLVIVTAVLFVFGLVSPLLAKYTPVILRSIPDLPAGLAAAIPEATLRDAVDQYIKNISQFGVLLVLVLTMGVMAQEKERGTAAMLLTKPVRRSAVVLAKWLAGFSNVLAGLVLGGLGCALYTALLFRPLPLLDFLALNLLMATFLGVYLSLALLASTLARTQTMAAAGAFGGLVLLLMIGALPRIGAYMPGELLKWGGALTLGEPVSAWPALLVSLGLIVFSLVYACLHFAAEEI